MTDDSGLLPVVRLRSSWAAGRFNHRVTSLVFRQRIEEYPRRAFTLIELLVVIVIIGLLAVATLPIVVPSLQQSSINAAARELQAELSVARDSATRGQAAHGIRFLPDPVDPARPNVLTSSRYVAIEQGPDYSEGLIKRGFDPLIGYPPPLDLVTMTNPSNDIPYLVIREDKFTVITVWGAIPNAPTGWFFNLRQGDKIQLNDSGRVYTIAGPAGHPAQPASFTPERFINFGGGYMSAPNVPLPSPFEFLYVVNGNDDDNDGYVDEAFDGINNDGDVYPNAHPLALRPVIDPGFNGIDDNLNGLIDEPLEMFLHFNSDGTPIYPGNTYGAPNGGYVATPYPNEYEPESFVGTINLTNPAIRYSVQRRPVPIPGSRESALPKGVVLDLTTWNAADISVLNPLAQPYVSERSRLPVDPFTRYVDILIAPGGQVVQQSYNANPAPPQNLPYYQFWLCDAEEVFEPFTPGQFAMLLPMLAGSSDDPSFQYPPAVSAGNYEITGQPPLRASRRLLSLNTQTGQVSTNSVETMYTNNPSHPFKAAERGQSEAP